MSLLASVVIPAHNRAGTIGRALSSVLAQTYSALEAIVVDDGSTDETARVVQEYARTDTRVQLKRHSERSGAQAARNAGIRAARGEWIAFLDSDDEWLPDSLALRLRVARDHRRHIVHSECYISDLGSSELRIWQVPALQGSVYRDLLRRSGTTFPSLLVSKEAFARIGCLDESIRSFQEWDTAIRLAKHYDFGFVREPTFIYYRGGADTVSRDMLRAAEGYEQVFTKHRRQILLHSGVRTVIAHYRRAADLYRTAGDEASERRCLRAATLWGPLAFMSRLQRCSS